MICKVSLPHQLCEAVTCHFMSVNWGSHKPMEAISVYKVRVRPEGVVVVHSDEFNVKSYGQCGIDMEWQSSLELI